MTDEHDERLMGRALELAARGRGLVEPNPLVGCVVARGAQVLGEGFHRQFGGPHAEVEALRACASAGAPTGNATVYVSLEPCCHSNKKTPPCVPTLLEAGITRVIVGCEDPNPQVFGRGIEQLRAAGVRVDLSQQAARARQINAAFFARVRHGRPYVTLKWAQTANGRIADPDGAPMQISNEQSTLAVHQLRARCDAIMVGINTVLSDDPRLTARGVEQARPLLRVVLDSKLRIPIRSRLAQTASEIRVLVYCIPSQENSSRAEELQALGIEVVAIDPHRLFDVLKDLGQRDVSHLLVEAGPTLARSFINQLLADRVWVIESSTVLGDVMAPAAPPINYPVVGEIKLDGDVLKEHLNQQSSAFFALEPSPDFAMVRP
jgi:diaminohydroxyphosphoribosylaminopyrimidine deaminase/5-amino-6-(5-phosphoribosylamino)uracil reductase